MGKILPKMSTCVPAGSRAMCGCYCGRRGLPRAWVEQMYEDYQRLASLAKAGALHKRTRQSMYGIFQTAGLPLNARPFKPVTWYRGRKYTQGGHGYLRDTIFRNGKYRADTLLHRRVWQDNFGPIPPGQTVIFKDGNRSNCAITNLECLTRAEQQARARTGRNHATKTAPARLALLLAGRGNLLAQLRLAREGTNMGARK